MNVISNEIYQEMLKFTGQKLKERQDIGTPQSISSKVFINCKEKDGDFTVVEITFVEGQGRRQQ